MNNKTWYIHRTSRKSKCELYIVTGPVNYSENVMITDETNDIKRSYFTREEAIQLRDKLNEKRKGKRYLWVINNDVSKAYEENTKDFKVDIDPVVPSHPTADKMLEDLHYHKYLGYETPTTSVYIHDYNKKRIIFDKKYGDFSVSSIDNIPMFLNEAEQKAVIKKREEIKRENIAFKQFKEPSDITPDDMFKNLGYKKLYEGDLIIYQKNSGDKKERMEVIQIIKSSNEFFKIKYLKKMFGGKRDYVTKEEQLAIDKKLEEIRKDNSK